MDQDTDSSRRQMKSESRLSLKMRDDARTIWQAAVDAVRPQELVPRALADPGIRESIRQAAGIVVLGAGKAGSAMSAALESALADFTGKVAGAVNVPAESVLPL